MKYQLIAGGLRIIKNLVRDCLDDENKDDGKNVMEQLPLPVMRNNDQRKEWLRNYKAWGLWYTDEHIGVGYYKYDFANGARLIAEEYDRDTVHSQWVSDNTESYYMHLIGGPEPERKSGIPKWTQHGRYNKFPNSESELVGILKGSTEGKQMNRAEMRRKAREQEKCRLQLNFKMQLSQVAGLTGQQSMILPELSESEREDEITEQATDACIREASGETGAGRETI
ncbi:MAG: hypothetical protein ACLTER_12605 [Ruminococcus sp.]